MVDAISSASASASSARTSLAGNFDTFLGLLTTQLQNQDPLSPMEADKFTEQLVQFTSVEQQIQTNSQLTQLVSIMQGNEMTSALQYLGKTVEVAGTSLHLPATGSVSGSYQLPRAAAEISLEIRNENGALVKRVDGDRAAGTHVFTWDGYDGQGNRLAAGVYDVKVMATDKSAETIDAELITGGKVDGIESGENGLSLVVNGLATPLSAVRSVVQSSSLESD